MKPEQTEITQIPKSNGLCSVERKQQGCVCVYDYMCSRVMESHTTKEIRALGSECVEAVGGEKG